MKQGDDNPVSNTSLSGTRILLIFRDISTLERFDKVKEIQRRLTKIIEAGGMHLGVMG